ncbi:hypothetical protein BDR03DRAFT_697040 [Suillus americanus]|nr:hypothetical protein BDR03DRAFT_697040 [Suillus americanus]
MSVIKLEEHAITNFRNSAADFLIMTFIVLMPPKKRKLSGLSGLELQFAHEGLVKLQKSLVYEEAEEEEGEEEGGRAPENFREQLKNMVSLLGSKVEGPRSYTFSSVTIEDLATFNITYTGMLDLKLDFVQSIEKTRTLGEGELWSAANLRRQLQFLECHIPRANKASARAWIDAFLFRASAMLPSNKHMILSMEHGKLSNGLYGMRGMQWLSNVLRSWT